MAALVETLFYTSNEANGRFVPWHGLGTSVSEAPTSKEAIKLAGLNWAVNPLPIYDKNGKEIPGFKANTRDSDDSVLGIVSDRYNLVQNSEAFEFTDSLVSDGEIRYETAGSLSNGKRIWLLAKMPETKILDDEVEPYICFSNTHDGTGAIKVCATPIRVVCNNTLNLALDTAKRSWSTKHMGDMASKLAEAKATLVLAKQYINELGIQADILANKKMMDADIEHILDELFPIDQEKDSARKIKNVQEMKDAFMVCYMAPDIQKFRNTAWGVINGMSDFVTHVSPVRKTENYQENNWGRIMNGHPIMDALVQKIAA